MVRHLKKGKSYGLIGCKNPVKIVEDLRLLGLNGVTYKPMVTRTRVKFAFDFYGEIRITEGGEQKINGYTFYYENN